LTLYYRHLYIAETDLNAVCWEYIESFCSIILSFLITKQLLR